MFSNPHSEYFWKCRRVASYYSGIVVNTAAKRYPTKVELSFSTNSNFTRDLINACDVKSIQQLPRLVTNLKVDLLVNYFTKNTSSLSFIFALKIATVIRLCTEENLFCPAAVNTFLLSWPTASTAQKMKFSIKDFFSKCNRIHTADLVVFTEEILNGKLHFLCRVQFFLCIILSGH